MKKMSENQTLPLTDQVENTNLIEENEELEEVEVSDDEVDEYFENSKSHIVDGIFDIQGATFSARYWHRRKLNDLAFMKSMGKVPTSLGALKILADDKNAKELAELWCRKNPNAADIENRLKQYPVDSAWSLVAILTNIEMTERAIAKAIRVKNAKRGGLAKPNKQKEFEPMIFEHWLKWQENRILYKSDVKFAEEMHYESDDVVSEDCIKRWCGKWKKARLLQIKNASA
jgi:hypothetical protein